MKKKYDKEISGSMLRVSQHELYTIYENPISWNFLVGIIRSFEIQNGLYTIARSSAYPTSYILVYDNVLHRNAALTELTKWLEWVVPVDENCTIEFFE